MELDQTEYLDTLTEIEISPSRKKTPDAEITSDERTQLRGLLGALQWLHTQSRMDLAAEIGLLQSCVTKAKVQYLELANKILRRARKCSTGTIFKIRRIPGKIACASWTDASLKNRVDHSSTGGYVIGLTSESIAKREVTPIVPISWRSCKLPRVAVSSLSAETQGLRIMEDEMHMVRLGWAEFQGQFVELDNHNTHVASVPGMAILDAKAIFDAVSYTHLTLPTNREV